MKNKNLVIGALSISAFILFLVVYWNDIVNLRIMFIILLVASSIMITIYETYWEFKPDNDD